MAKISIRQLRQDLIQTQSTVKKIELAQKRILVGCNGKRLEEIPESYRQWNVLRVSKANSKGRLKLLKQILAS